jgi:GNAT superfamily N-acetyltransferase
VEAARPAAPADVGRVARLARELATELAPLRGGRTWSAREARSEPLEAVFTALLERTDACVAVGTIDDTVVGYGVVELEALRTGEVLGRITDLFIEPGARAVGVGEAVLGVLVEFCVAHGCVGIDAPALPGHRAAKNFFEESGFTARLLVMHRALADPAG